MSLNSEGYCSCCIKVQTDGMSTLLAEDLKQPTPHVRRQEPGQGELCPLGAGRGGEGMHIMQSKPRFNLACDRMTWDLGLRPCKPKMLLQEDNTPGWSLADVQVRLGKG